jgi:hypothetical protein
VTAVSSCCLRRRFVAGAGSREAVMRASRRVVAHQVRSVNMALTEGVMASAMSVMGALPP